MVDGGEESQQPNHLFLAPAHAKEIAQKFAQKMLANENGPTQKQAKLSCVPQNPS